MHRCLELAARGRGLVGNGAMVGAVLVRKGQVIAEGWHRGFGLPHAERDLLERFTGQIEPSDILYVNLEPCCHHGKTPPCTQIVIDRGIKTVVYGMLDPDPRVSGRVRALLEEQKVKLIGPVLRAQCEWFNRGFISVRTKNRPWIILKKAQTADGQVAKPDGTKLKITSPEQDSWSHKYLRALTDAIIVGSGTVSTDDPELTIRLKILEKENAVSALHKNEKSDYINCSYRIVLDPSFSSPVTAKVFTDFCREKTIVLTSKTGSQSPAAQKLAKAGIKIIPVKTSHDGAFDWQDLWSVLLTPADGYNGITSVLVEGGRKTWNRFLSSGFVDEQITLLKK